MANCGLESNAISLDAHEIANLIFSDEVIEDQLTFEDIPGKLLSFFNIKTEPELKLKNRIK